MHPITSKMPFPRVAARAAVALLALLMVQVGPQALSQPASAVGAEQIERQLGQMSSARAAIIRRGLITKKKGYTFARITVLVGDDPDDEVVRVQVGLEKLDGSGATWAGSATPVCPGHATVPVEGEAPSAGAGCGVVRAEVEGPSTRRTPALRCV